MSTIYYSYHFLYGVRRKDIRVRLDESNLIKIFFSTLSSHPKQRLCRNIILIHLCDLTTAILSKQSPTIVYQAKSNDKW